MHKILHQYYALAKNRTYAFISLLTNIYACINASDGYFAFDMVHVRKYDYWNALKTGIEKYLNQ